MISDIQAWAPGYSVLGLLWRGQSIFEPRSWENVWSSLLLLRLSVCPSFHLQEPRSPMADFRSWLPHSLASCPPASH